MARDLASDLAVCASRTGGTWRGAQSAFDQAGLAVTIPVQIAMENIPGNDYANAVFCAEASEGWQEAIERAQAAEAAIAMKEFEIKELRAKLMQKDSELEELRAKLAERRPRKSE